MYIDNSSTSGCSPSDVIPNMSASFAFLQRISFCISWDFDSSVILGVVHKLSTSVKIYSSVEVETPAFARIQEISLIPMSTFDSILLVGTSFFTQGEWLGFLQHPKNNYVFLKNYLILKQICKLTYTTLL